MNEFFYFILKQSRKKKSRSGFLNKMRKEKEERFILRFIYLFFFLTMMWQGTDKQEKKEYNQWDKDIYTKFKRKERSLWRLVIGY